MQRSGGSLNQVHSSRVLEADEIISDAEDADASFTTKSNVGCVVMTRGCLPILYVQKDGEIVCALARRLERIGRRRDSRIRQKK